MNERKSIALTLTLVAIAWGHAAVAQSGPSVTLATQGGVTITLEDVDAYVQKIPDSERAGFFRNPSRVDAMLRNLLVQRRLANDARRAGLDQSPDVAKQLLLAEEEVLARADAKRFRSEITVPDLTQLAKEKYLANKSQYSVPETLRIRQLVVSTDSRSEEEARKLAEDLLAQAASDPSAFEELIESRSDEPTREITRGELDVTRNDRYGGALTAAARSIAKAGEFAPVIQTSDGFHVIQLMSKTPARQRSFDEVKDELRASLEREYVQKQISNRYDQLRNEPIESNGELINSLRDRYANPGS